jgi:hypothetical protein
MNEFSSRNDAKRVAATFLRPQEDCRHLAVDQEAMMLRDVIASTCGGGQRGTGGDINDDCEFIIFRYDSR